MKTRAGLSLIEIMIGIAILTVLILMVYSLLFSATDHVGKMSIAADLEMQARAIIDEITRDLRGAQRSTLTLTGSSKVSFSTVSGFSMNVGGAPGPVSGYTITWNLAVVPPETVDGADNNGDGLVDESRITRFDSKNNVTSSRTDRATATGLDFVHTANPGPDGVAGTADDKDTVAVTVTLQGLDQERRLVTRSYTSTVVLRN